MTLTKKLRRAALLRTPDPYGGYIAPPEFVRAIQGIHRWNARRAKRASKKRRRKVGRRKQ